MTEMTQRWAGPVVEVNDLGDGTVSVIYDDPAYAARGDEAPSTVVPAADTSGRKIAVGDELVLEQDFRDGTAVATVNGQVYCRWTGMARRVESTIEPA